jgi:hypothetical protein
MELLTIILSGVLGIFSTLGVVVDKNVDMAFRSQMDRVEQLEVRSDNAPNYQIISGKINKLRIAGRGLWVSKDLRIDTLEIETDPLAINLKDVQEDGSNLRSTSVQKPIQAGVRLKFNQEDLNNYLKSPDAIARLQKMTTSTLGSAGSSLGKDYQVVNPQVRFLANNRVGIRADLKDAGSGEKLTVDLESGVNIIGGRKFQLVDTTAKVGETPVPSFILAGLTAGLTERLNVDMFEERGLTARILQFKVSPQQLELAAFVRLSGSK